MPTIEPQQPPVVPRQACGRYTCCALAPQVHNLSTGEEDDGPAMLPQPPAEVHFLGKEKIAIVERTHTLNCLPPEQQACPDDPINLTRRAMVAPVQRRVPAV